MYAGKLLERDLLEARDAISGLDRVAAIDVLVGRGLNNTQIGQVLGVTGSRISRIVRGVPRAASQTWGCLQCARVVLRDVPADHEPSADEGPLECSACHAIALVPSSAWDRFVLRLTPEHVAALVALAPAGLPQTADVKILVERAIYALLSQRLENDGLNATRDDGPDGP